MPIKIPDKLPAKSILENENIFVMTEKRAIKQDIRPLKILILNLMPTKIETETQLLRLLSNTPLQVEINLMKTASYWPTNVSKSHLLSFYKDFDDIKDQKFDGMIITGAPIEQMEFEKVAYWDELCEIMEWTKHNVFSVFHICWGAQAGLYYHYGIQKYPLDEKMFGVFPHHTLNKSHKLLRGFDDVFMAPHSRHTEIKREDIEKCPELEVLSYSDIAGVYIVADRKAKNFYVTGHSEYEFDTLSKEYFRDVNKQIKIKMPYNYFPDNNPENTPTCTWRSHSSLLFSNWLNYFVYQATPYDITKII